MSALTTYEFVLEYAKVLDIEGLGGPDCGDAQSPKKWLRELSKNPVFKVNAYFTSEEDMQDLLQNPLFENEVINPQTQEKTTRIKEGDSQYGIGRYITLSRKTVDVREIMDKKKGLVEVDYGGAPKVLVKKDDVWVDYDVEDEELGLIGNGSSAKIRFHPKYLRLEKVGVTELIEFIDNTDEVDEDGF